MTRMGRRLVADVSSLGAAVREARRSKGLTQAQLAERAEVSRQFVLNLEKGNSTRAELGRVLAVLRALDQAVLFVDTSDNTQSRPSTAHDIDLDDALDEVLGAASSRSAASSSSTGSTQ